MRPSVRARPLRSAAIAAGNALISAKDPLMVISRRNTSYGLTRTRSSGSVTPENITVPPLRVSGTHCSDTTADPVASTTMSNPPPEAAFSLAASPARSARSIRNVASSPRSSARLSLNADEAATVTLAAPPRAMSWASSRPVGPAPKTRGELPGRGLGEHRDVGIDAVHREDQAGGDRDVFGERAGPVRAEPLEVGAQQGAPGPAVLAVPAAHVRVDRDVLAEPEPLG